MKHSNIGKRVWVTDGTAWQGNIIEEKEHCFVVKGKEKGDLRSCIKFRVHFDANDAIAECEKLAEFWQYEAEKIQEEDDS